MAYSVTRLRLYVAGSLLALSGVVSGSTPLQVFPITLTLLPDTFSSGLTLTNGNDSVIYGQVRVFRWTQENGEDVLSSAQDDLGVSPPLIQIAAQSTQLVRLVPFAKARGTGEQSYRVFIDQLPTNEAALPNRVSIQVRYSVPVFIEPKTATTPPKLHWGLVNTPSGWLLRVRNTGGRRAQLSKIQLVDKTGKAYEISRGLFGYVLAGSMRQWPLKLRHPDPNQFRNVQATINSSQKIDDAVIVE